MQEGNPYAPIVLFSAREWTYRNLRNDPDSDWTLKEKVTSEDARNKDLLSRIKKRFRMNKSSK